MSKKLPIAPPFTGGKQTEEQRLKAISSPTSPAKPEVKKKAQQELKLKQAQKAIRQKTTQQKTTQQKTKPSLYQASFTDPVLRNILEQDKLRVANVDYLKSKGYSILDFDAYKKNKKVDKYHTEQFKKAAEQNIKAAADPYYINPKTLNSLKSNSEANIKEKENERKTQDEFISKDEASFKKEAVEAMFTVPEGSSQEIIDHYNTLKEIYNNNKNKPLETYAKEYLENIYEAYPELRDTLTVDTLLYGKQEYVSGYSLNNLRTSLLTDYNNTQAVVKEIDATVNDAWKTHQQEVDKFLKDNQYNSLYDWLYNRGGGKSVWDADRWEGLKEVFWDNGIYKIYKDDNGNKRSFGDAQKQILLRTLNELEDFDILATFVKAGVKSINAGEAKSYFNDMLKVAGLSFATLTPYAGEYAIDLINENTFDNKYINDIFGYNVGNISYTNDYNTGNNFADLALEFVSDPLDWIDWGASGIGKAAAKRAARSSDDLVQASLDVFKNADVLKGTDLLKKSDDELLNLSKRFANQNLDTLPKGAIDELKVLLKTDNVTDISNFLKLNTAADAIRHSDELRDAIGDIVYKQMKNNSLRNGKTIDVGSQVANVYARQNPNGYRIIKEALNNRFSNKVVDNVTYGAALIAKASDDIQRGVLKTALSFTPIPYASLAYKATKPAIAAASNRVAKNLSKRSKDSKAMLETFSKELKRTNMHTYERIADTLDDEAKKLFKSEGALKLQDFLNNLEVFKNNADDPIRLAGLEGQIAYNNMYIASKTRELSLAAMETSSKEANKFADTIIKVLDDFKVKDVTELEALLLQYSDLSKDCKDFADDLLDVIKKESTSIETTGKGSIYSVNADQVFGNTTQTKFDTTDNHTDMLRQDTIHKELNVPKEVVDAITKDKTKFLQRTETVSFIESLRDIKEAILKVDVKHSSNYTDNVIKAIDSLKAGKINESIHFADAAYFDLEKLAKASVESNLENIADAFNPFIENGLSSTLRNTVDDFTKALDITRVEQKTRNISKAIEAAEKNSDLVTIYKQKDVLRNVTQDLLDVIDLSEKSLDTYLKELANITTDSDDILRAADNTRALLYSYVAYNSLIKRINIGITDRISKNKVDIINMCVDKIVNTHAMDLPTAYSNSTKLVLDTNNPNSIKSVLLKYHKELTTAEIDDISDFVYRQYVNYLKELTTIGIRHNAMDILTGTPDVETFCKQLDVLNNDTFRNLNYNLSIKFDDIRETAIKDSNYSILQGTSVTQSKIGELTEDKAIYTTSGRKINYNHEYRNITYFINKHDPNKAPDIDFMYRPNKNNIVVYDNHSFFNSWTYMHAGMFKDITVEEGRLSLMKSVANSLGTSNSTAKKLFDMTMEDYALSSTVRDISEMSGVVVKDNGVTRVYTNLTEDMVDMYTNIAQEEYKLLKDKGLFSEYFDYIDYGKVVFGDETLDDASQLNLNLMKNYGPAYKIHAIVQYNVQNILANAERMALSKGITSKALDDLAPFISKEDLEMIQSLNKIYESNGATVSNMLYLNSIDFLNEKKIPAAFLKADDTVYGFGKVRNFILEAPENIEFAKLTDGLEVLDATNTVRSLFNTLRSEGMQKVKDFIDEFQSKSRLDNLEKDTRYSTVRTVEQNIINHSVHSILTSDVKELPTRLLRDSGGFVLIDPSVLKNTEVSKLTDFIKTVNDTEHLFIKQLEDYDTPIYCIYTDLAKEAEDVPVSKIVSDKMLELNDTELTEKLIEINKEVNARGIADTYELMSTTLYHNIRNTLPDDIKKVLPNVDTLHASGYLTDTKCTNFYLGPTARSNFIQEEWAISSTYNLPNTIKQSTEALNNNLTKRAQFVNLFINDRIKLLDICKTDAEIEALVKNKNTTGVIIVQDKKVLSRKGGRTIYKYVPKAVQVDLTKHTIADLKKMNPAMLLDHEAKQIVSMFNADSIPSLFEATMDTLSSVYKANALTSLSWLKNNLVSSLRKDIIAGDITLFEIPRRISFMLDTLNKIQKYNELYVALQEYSTKTAPEDIRMLDASRGAYNEKTLEAFFEQPQYKEFKQDFIDLDRFITYGPTSMSAALMKVNAENNVIKGRTLKEALQNKDARFEKANKEFTPYMSEFEKKYRIGLQSVQDVAWKNMATRKLTDWNSNLEQFFRYDTYRWEREAGASFDEANRVVSYAHFDYDNSTRFSKTMDFIMPFFSYQYSNLLFWAKAIHNNPTLARAMLATYKANGATDLTEDDLTNNELWANQILQGSFQVGEFTVTFNRDDFDWFSHALNPISYIEDTVIYSGIIKPILDYKQTLAAIDAKEQEYAAAVLELLGTKQNVDAYGNQITEEQWKNWIAIWKAKQQQNAYDYMLTGAKQKFIPFAGNILRHLTKIKKYYERYNPESYKEDPGLVQIFAGIAGLLPDFISTNKKYFYNYEDNNLTPEEWIDIKNTLLDTNGYLLPSLDKHVGDAYSTTNYKEYERLLSEGAKPGGITKDVLHYSVSYIDYEGVEHKVRTTDKMLAVSLLTQTNSVALNDNAKALNDWRLTEMSAGYLDLVDIAKGVYRFHYSGDNTTYILTDNDKYSGEDRFINKLVTGDIVADNVLASEKLQFIAPKLDDKQFIAAYDTMFNNIRYSYKDYRTGEVVQRCIAEADADPDSDTYRNKYARALLYLVNGNTPENKQAKDILNSPMATAMLQDKQVMYDFANKNGYYVVHWDFINKDIIYDNKEKAVESLRKGSKPMTKNAQQLVKDYDIKPKQYTQYPNYNYNNYNSYKYNTAPIKTPLYTFYYGTKPYITKDANKYKAALANGATNYITSRKPKHTYAYNKAKYNAKHTYTKHTYTRYNSNYGSNSNITSTIPYSNKPQRRYRKPRIVTKNMMQRKYRLKYSMRKK